MASGAASLRKDGELSMQAKFPPFTEAAVSDAKPLPAHEVSPVEAKLRTALQYLYHSRLLIDEALSLLPVQPLGCESQIQPESLPEPAEVLRERLEAVDEDTTDVA
jgi:hypothetical protein